MHPGIPALGSIFAVIVLLVRCGWPPSLCIHTLRNYAAVQLVQAATVDPLGSQARLSVAVSLGERLLRADPSDEMNQRLVTLVYLLTRQLPQVDGYEFGVQQCQDSFTCFLLGQAFLLMNDEEKAFALWRAIPNVDVFLAHQADAAYAQNNKAKALQLYMFSWNLSQEITPEKSVMLLNLCRYQRGRGNLIEAVEWCKLALGAKNDYWTLVEMGRTYYEAGRCDLAEITLREALTLMPNQGAAYQWLGVTLSCLGRVADGVDALSTSVGLNPQSIWPRLELANLFYLQQNHAAAACEYFGALNLTQDPVQIQMIQAKINLMSISEDDLRQCKGQN